MDYLVQNTVTFPLPRPLLTMPGLTVTPASTSYLVTQIGDKTRFVFIEDTGEENLPHTINLKHVERGHESYECDGEVMTAVAKIHREHIVEFNSLEFTDTSETDIGISIKTHQVMSGDADRYTLEEKLVVSWTDCGEEVFSRKWKDVIPRQDHNTC